MSDFLARLAARAVGQVAVAQPRVPSLFEAASGPDESRDAIDVIHDEVTAGPMSRLPSSAAPRSVAAPAGDGSTAGDTESPTGAVAPATWAVGATREPVTHRTDPAQSRQGQDASHRPDGPRPPTMIVGDLATDKQHGARSSDRDPAPPTVPTVPAVPLASATPVTSWAAHETIGSPSPSTPEPPAVRVHIGRLEIRANVPEAAPARPPAREVREEAAQGVSLADYLRGAR